MADKHTSSLNDVREGNRISATIEGSEVFVADCAEYTEEHADERTGEIRLTKMWIFEDADEDRQLVASILEGLKSSPDDPEFPQHSPLWDMDAEETVGYITELNIED